MTYVDLLNHLSQKQKRLFRDFEREKKKLFKAKWSKTFNEVCLKENMLPNYTNIYIYIYTYNMVEYYL